MFGKKKQHVEELNNRRQPRYNGSSKVFSYYANRSSELPHETRLRPDQERLADTYQSSWLVQLPVLLSVGVIVVCVLYNLVLTSTPRVIVEQQDSQTASISDEQLAVYEQNFSELFKDSWSSRTKLTVQTSDITDQILAAYPEVEIARVALPAIGQRPLVYIVPATQFAYVRSTNGVDYALTDTGKVMSPVVGNDKKSTTMLTIIDNSGLGFVPGDQAFSRSNITAMKEVVTQLRAKKIQVPTITLPANSQSFHAAITGKSYFVKFTFQEDARTQAGAFIAAYQRFERENQHPREYADVRVADRVYFK